MSASARRVGRAFAIGLGLRDDLGLHRDAAPLRSMPMPRPKDDRRCQGAMSLPRPRSREVLRPDDRPMTARMAPADAAEPISEQAVLDARSSRSEATVADLASATLVGRSTVRIALAKTRFRDGSVAVPAGARVRAAPARGSVAAERADAEPAVLRPV